VVSRLEASRLLDRTSEGTLTLLVMPHWPGTPAAVPWLADQTLRRKAFRQPDTAVASLTLERGGRINEGDGHIVLVLVGRPDGLARRGLAVAKALAPDEVHALYVEIEPEETDAVLEEWSRSDLGIEPEVVPAPYREPGGPVRARIEELRRGTHAVVSVVAPRLGLRWWQRPLYENSTRQLRRALATAGTTALVECRLPLAISEMATSEAVTPSQR
jgi:hypothetical protein